MGLPSVPEGLARAADDQRDALVAQANLLDRVAEDGRYVQVAWSGDPPADGAEVDDQSGRPPHRQIGPDDVGLVRPSRVRAAWAFDEYVGPQGAGLVYRDWVEIAGSLWVRSTNVRGPETWRTHDWQEIIR